MSKIKFREKNLGKAVVGPAPSPVILSLASMLLASIYEMTGEGAGK